MLAETALPDAVFDMDVGATLGALTLRARLRTNATRLAIVGPSGAGKSTLLRVLAGLERRATGHIQFRGKTWLGDEGRTWLQPWQRRAAWVPQDARLFPHLDVRRNLMFARAEDAGQELPALAAQLGIERLLDRMPRHLSGGEAQRVSLGRALLARPGLLLLDEPFAALDRPRRAELAGLLRELADERDFAFVLVAHDERDVASLAGELCEMREGELPAAALQVAP